MAGTVELWFRKTYRLAPTDPRYLDAPLDDIFAEYWAWHYDERRAAGKPDEEEFEVDEEDFAADVAAMMANADEWEDVPAEGEG